MIYLQIFWVFIKIGLSGFGGGYAMLPLFRQEVVVHRGWVSAAEFADIVAVAQVMPGPISINCAAYIGYAASHSALGGALAILAVILPSFILMMGVCVFWIRFKENLYLQAALTAMRPAVVGLIAAAALSMLNADNILGYKSVLIFVAACLSAWLFKANPLLIIALAGALGIILFKPK